MATISSDLRLPQEIRLNNQSLYPLKSQLWKAAAIVSSVALIAIGAVAALIILSLSIGVLAFPLFAIGHPFFLLPLALLATAVIVIPPVALLTKLVFNQCMVFSRENAQKQQSL